MRIDCHVHLSAVGAGRGKMSPRLLRSLPFRFLRWKFDLPEPDESIDEKLAELLSSQLAHCAELDAAVVLAFDAVHDKDGVRDEFGTHLELTNDYVIDLCTRYPNMLFGASVHPYRKDAIAELERCARAGAVLVKWLPITQGIDPSNERCYAFYDALAHLKIPLLSHTGGEKMLPNVNHCADPTLLTAALRRGVTVIAAHCGTKSSPLEIDYVPAWSRMALEHEHFYGDTSALNLPTRMYAYRTVLADDRLRNKLVHGSDWPVMPVPNPLRLGVDRSFRLMEEPNWIRRDVLIKQQLGLDEAYWERAGKILRLADRA